MSRVALAVAVVLAAAAGGAGCPRRGAPAEPAIAAPPDVVAAATGTLEKWRQAYEIRSLDGLARLYARDPELVIVHEGSALTGWPAIETMLKDRFAKTTAIRVRLKDIRVSALAPEVAGAVATMSRELSDATTTVAEQGTLTMVLRKADAGWVIVAEHYSYRRAS